MRCTACLVTLFSCFAVCLADLVITVPSPSFALNAPMPVQWTRGRNDPAQFLLQTIKFATVIQPTQELIRVDSNNDTLSGSTTIISRFAGPHILVALDPNSLRILATSNPFDAGNVVATVPAAQPTEAQSSSPTQSASHSGSQSVPVGAIVGGVIGGLASLILGIIAFLYFRRRLRKRYGITPMHPDFEHPSTEKFAFWRPTPLPLPSSAATTGSRTASAHPISLTDVDMGDHPYEVSSSSQDTPTGTGSRTAAAPTPRKGRPLQPLQPVNRVSAPEDNQYGADVPPPPSYVSSPTAPVSPPRPNPKAKRRDDRI